MEPRGTGQKIGDSRWTEAARLEVGWRRNDLQPGRAEQAVATLRASRLLRSGDALAKANAAIDARVAQADACQPVTDAALSDIERLVVQYAAQVTRNVKVDDALFADMQSRFTTTELVELTIAIATYNMVARFLVALQITPDGEAPR